MLELAENNMTRWHFTLSLRGANSTVDYISFVLLVLLGFVQRFNFFLKPLSALRFM